MAQKSVHVIVKGVVQGVGYRHFTYKRGNAMGLRGWVRNCPDGNVEVYAEGEDHLLADFLRELERGPWSSVVDELEVKWGENSGWHQSFEVRF